MIRNLLRSLVLLVVVSATPTTLEAQVVAELDALWERVAQSVRTGDPDLYLSTYHPDAIFVSARRGISRTVVNDVETNREAWRATAEGRAERDVEFRFTRRIHDESSAHEVGIFRYSSVENGTRTVATIHFSAALVKVDGEWLQLLEYQDSDATDAEWDAAGGP
jgi:hypothetical protein